MSLHSGGGIQKVLGWLELVGRDQIKALSVMVMIWLSLGGYAWRRGVKWEVRGYSGY